MPATGHANERERATAWVWRVTGDECSPSNHACYDRADLAVGSLIRVPDPSACADRTLHEP